MKNLNITTITEETESIQLFFYEGYTCPICQRPFQANEDVVSCPKCGLPHHRACWMQDGHCHLQHLHDTDEQWSRDKATTGQKETEIASATSTQHCPRCHTKNPEFAEICTHCGMLLQPEQEFGNKSEPTYHEYRPHGTHFRSTHDETSVNEKIDDVKTSDLMAVVGSKTDYYIPRFRRISRGNRTSWNWAAFLITPYWLLYRKMYAYGVLLLLLQLLQSCITYLVYHALNITADMDPTVMMQTLQSAAIHNPSILYYFLSISLISSILFVISVLFGVFGNRLYQQHCHRVIHRAKKNTPDITSGELATIGGTSISIAFIGYISLYFITQIMALLIM